MDATPSYISLFSGCGGLDVGMETLGWRCVAQSEIDKDCCAILRERFPNVPNLGDITEVDWSNVPRAEALVGGFPCQDLSYAGRGAGLEGTRSGLWFSMADAIRALEPRFVLIENVPGLLGRGLHVVTHDLACAGYVGTWRTLAAADLGAPHRRERVFIVGRRDDSATDVGGQASLLGRFTEEGWESPQVSLLDGTEYLDRLPKAGAWTRKAVFEFELAEADDDGVLLLPTPNAYESTPTDDFVEEMRAAGIQPDARLYLPGRKWFAQRTLSRVAAALLPTPGANDANGAEGETRDARRESGATGGPSLRDLPRLLPTPQGRDGHGPQGNAYKGEADDLPAAAARVSGTSDYALLPTPTTQDGENCGGPSQHERNTPPLNAEVTKLLPTPVANPENPGAGGELRAAIHHGPERRTDSDTDTFGRPIRKGRLLPTPEAADGSGGRVCRDPETLETGKRPSGTKASVPLATALDRDVTLLPTPRVEASRSSRKALVENQQWSAPSLEQAVEIAQGILPREFESWDEVKGKDHPSGEATDVQWGDYEPAIRRWEAVIGRPAPLPTDEKGRLSPAFVEWMLGFPAGWVFIAGSRRTAQLRMLGNAVQVQCAQVAGLWLAELGGTA